MDISTLWQWVSNCGILFWFIVFNLQYIFERSIFNLPQIFTGNITILCSVNNMRLEEWRAYRKNVICLILTVHYYPGYVMKSWIHVFPQSFIRNLSLKFAQLEVQLHIKYVLFEVRIPTEVYFWEYNINWYPLIPNSSVNNEIFV